MPQRGAQRRQLFFFKEEALKEGRLRMKKGRKAEIVGKCGMEGGGHI